jgi:N-acetylglutamate synthase
VGQRIVVRRIVPGERGATGGPAFTDVLGVCTAWPDPSEGPEGEVVVETDQGPVSFPAGLVVSGKPVPPRPSVRMRVSPREAELRTALLWPTVVTRPLGEWQLRAESRPEGRLLKRANSCLAMGSPGLAVEEALARVQAHYERLERQPLLQVEADGDVEAAARAAGWEPLGRGDAAFLLAPGAQLARRLSTGDHAVRIAARHDRVEADVVDSAALRIATGSAVLDGDWLGIHDLAVDPGHRRRGLATALLAALVEWGAEQGARTVWLHVEVDNAGARALYEGLGFAEHHLTRYLTPTPARTPAS